MLALSLGFSYGHSQLISEVGEVFEEVELGALDARELNVQVWLASDLEDLNLGCVRNASLSSLLTLFVLVE